MSKIYNFRLCHVYTISCVAIFGSDYEVNQHLRKLPNAADTHKTPNVSKNGSNVVKVADNPIGGSARSNK